MKEIKKEPVVTQTHHVSSDKSSIVKLESQVNQESHNGFYRFRLDKNGVWYIPESVNDKTPDPIWVCSLLTIFAITRDQNGENHGKLLQFMDSDGKVHQWAMPMELLSGDGNEYRKALLSMGLKIAPGRKPRDLLTMYIQTAEPCLKVRCVTKTGWIDNSYVFPDKTLGKEESIFFQSPVKVTQYYQVNGSLEDWKQQIAEQCVDNSRLSFAVSVALASPLLKIINGENCGFHFQGPSSNGKTTTLKVAASIFGGKEMIHTWRATSNGLESIAVLHNDSLLCLDEMGQMNSKEAGETAYMLANGMGKSRANKHAYARSKHDWRILFLSSGEISLAEHMREGGKRIRAGQEVRIINIPSDTGQYGAFEHLHKSETGAAFSRDLCQASEQFFGSAGRTFIQKIIDQGISHVEKRMRQIMDAFIAKYTCVQASGQVDRVLHKFAFVAAAGTLATEYGITGWPDEEASWGAEECFKSWVENRGGTSPQEEKSALEQVRHFFELHGDSRFSLWNLDEPSGRTINRAGFKKIVDGTTHFYVFQEVFKHDICSGMNPEYVSKVLIAKEWLMPDSEGKSSRSEKLPGFDSSVRCYRFIGDKMFEDSI